MAVTILERPQGRVLSETGITAKVDDAYGSPDASVFSLNHGLSDGAFVYIVSGIDDYNGFFYVDSTGTNTFKIKQYEDSDYVQFSQDQEITYYVSQLSHGWSAVHLPITYRVLSDLYPVNSVDTIRNVNSYSDDNGVVVLNISGSLGTIHTFDFIELVSPNEADISGKYQILDWISNTVIVINLTYDSTYNLSGATVQKVYNNYNINIRIYAGINPSHEWSYKKPYELAATLELIPDQNNECFFSVNDILKNYVKTVNNPTISTKPNNIDFWTNFYIEIAESYDDSDGYSYGRFQGSYTSDQSNFEGYAVNSKLPFKNIYSGFMSEYIMASEYPGKFLTVFSTPYIFNIPYQDISFIKSTENELEIHFQYYANGQPGILDVINIIGDPGVYRVPVSANCSYDRVDITMYENIEFPAIDTLTGNLLVTGYAPAILVGPA